MGLLNKEFNVEPLEASLVKAGFVLAKYRENDLMELETEEETEEISILPEKVPVYQYQSQDILVEVTLYDADSAWVEVLNVEDMTPVRFGNWCHDWVGVKVEVYHTLKEQIKGGTIWISWLGELQNKEGNGNPK